jgi:hypothetical protein
MAEIKISQLVAASSHAGDDVFMILQNGINKKTDLSTIMSNLNSYNNIRINASQNAIATTISSKNIANLLYVDGVSDKIGIGTNTLRPHILTVNGSISVGSDLLDGVVITSSEEVFWVAGDPTKALSITRQTSHVSVQAGQTGLFSLAPGFDGQIKAITSMTTSTANITCAGLGGAFSSIELNTKGEGVILVYKGSGSITGWTVLGNNGAVIA